MPNYISHNGEWVPAKEKVAITDKNGNPIIYEGDDRAAMEEIKTGNVTSKPFWEDTEFINRVRQVFNMSIEEYMKVHNFDKNTSKAEFEKKLSVVNTHQTPTKKRASKFRSGGSNTAGTGGDKSGDFGSFEEAKKNIN